MSTPQRKDEHLDICLNEPVDQRENFFDDIELEHNALPEINFSEIDTGTKFLGKKISAPLVISSMTGGTEKGRKINERLAKAAEKCQIALGIGSGRAMVENEKLTETFSVRKFAPTIPLLANLGAVQLNYGYGVEECKKLIAALEADALCLHLNPLQEAIQPEGDTNFSGLLKNIEKIVKGLKVPVIVKEVGCGISGLVAKKLYNVGVRHIDISGRGGTSWPFIEGKRRKETNPPNPLSQGGFLSPPDKAFDSESAQARRGDLGRALGILFANWGIPTPQAIRECAKIKGLTIIAGGGIRSGVDMAKALALGASYASMALPFLKAAVKSEQVVVELIEKTVYELKVAMFGTGSKYLAELKEKRIS